MVRNQGKDKNNRQNQNKKGNNRGGNRNNNNRNHNNNNTNNNQSLSSRDNYHRPNTTKVVPPQQQPPKSTHHITPKDLKINLPQGMKPKGISVDQDEISFRKQRIQKTIEALKNLEQVLGQFQYPDDLGVEGNILSILKQIQVFQKPAR